MTDHETTLRKAATTYRHARPNLITAIRNADAAGMRQVDILRAIDHVWTREQVRRIIRGEAPAGG